MNTLDFSSRSNQEQAATTPTRCCWHSPPCEEPPTVRVRWRSPGELTMHRAVFCRVHALYASNLAHVEEEVQV